MKIRTTENRHVCFAALTVIRGLAGPGLFTSVGVLFPLIAREIGVGVGALSLSVSIASVSGAAFLPFAGWCYRHLPARAVTVSGVVLTALPFALFGLVRNLFFFYLLSVPFGVGTVVLVNLMAPVHVRAWEPDRTGSVMGWLLAGAGLVGAVVQPALAAMIASFGWRVSSVILGTAAGALMLLFSLFTVAPRSGSVREEPGKEEKTDLLDPVFLSLALFMAVITGFSAFHQHFTAYGLDAGFSLSTVGRVLGLSMVASALGAVALGWVGERIGEVRAGVGILTVGCVSVLLFLFGAGHPGFFLLAGILHGFVSSAIGITVPAVAARFFSGDEYASRLSRIMVAAPLATATLTPLFGLSFDLSGSYTLPLILLFCVLAFTASVFAFALSPRLPDARRGSER